MNLDLSVCPLCKSNLLNEPIITRKADSFWRKSCESNLDHKFAAVFDINTNFISNFTISDRKNVFIFQPSFKHLFVARDQEGKKKNVIPPKRKSIPYFEPDFSDKKRLFNKLNTYLCLI